MRKLLDNELLDSEERKCLGDWLDNFKELSRGLVAPTEVHKTKLKTLLRYLSGTKEIGRQVKSLDIRFMWTVVGPVAPTPGGPHQE